MKIIVLGAGLVGVPMAIDLAKDKNFDVSISDINERNLSKIDNKFDILKIEKDLSDKSLLKELIKDYDLVLNALPGFMGYKTLESIIEAGKNVVDISFFPEDAFGLDILAKKNGVTAIMDCGVAPGMSYILVGYVNDILDKTENVEIYVGGLPKIRTWPYEYKAVFSPADVIEEYTRPARFVKEGKLVTKEALSDIELMDFENIGTLEAFNSDGLRSLIKTIDCPNMIEKTLRYPGHVEKMKMLRETGFFNKETILINGKEVSPLDFTSKLLFPKWELKEGEEDVTIMKIIVEGEKDNKKLKYSYDLFDSYDVKTKTHSMARTTGYTATMAVRMLNEKLFNEKGIIVPEYIGKHHDCVKFMLDGLKERAVVYKESLQSDSQQ